MLRFGTIGSGWIVDEYIHGAKDSGLWELTAVYSRTAERAQAFAQKHGRPVVYGFGGDGRLAPNRRGVHRQPQRVAL